ncbi:extracellular solute-binding protein [Acutalibacter caecimuris]|uniref:extracellular solute-binding protein n=1 Tax=Acutalibacter caecimuris TaxID=3093657 RepID=UPI002AC9057A|nr:extracellular solute-binding protein [Acutalibacter sp. M00118]
MKLKKTMSVLLVLLMLVICFSACTAGGNSEGQKSGTDSSSSGNAVSESSAGQPEEAGDPGEKVTIEYYTWGDEEGYLAPIVDAFNAQSEHTIVHANYVPTGSDPDAYVNRVTALLAGGGEMDVFGSSTVKVMIAYRDGGSIADLTDAIKAAGIDLDGYGEDFASTLADGKCYALPYRFSSFALFYNKLIFDAEKIPYPEKMTWDEYAELAKSMTKTRDDGTTQWGGFIPDWMGEPILAVQMGSSVLDENTEPLKNWLGLLGRLYNEDKSHMSFEEMRSTSVDWVDIFLRGDVAMLPNGEWTVGNAKQKLADNPDLAGKCEIGIAYMPQPEGVQDPVTIGGHNTFILINKNSQKFDHAFEFVQYLTGAEGAKMLAEAGVLPSHIDDSTIDAFEKSAGISDVSPLFNSETHYEAAPVDIFSEVDTIWREEKELYLIGEKTLDETIDSFTQRRAPILNK